MWEGILKKINKKKFITKKPKKTVLPPYALNSILINLLNALISWFLI